MASWEEDTVQALKTLGGKAYWEDLFAEVVRVRHILANADAKVTFHKTLWEYSTSTSKNQGQVFFKYEGKGFWALKISPIKNVVGEEKQESKLSRADIITPDWIKDTRQALKNLGGKAHQKKIIEEVAQIRKDPLLNRVKLMVLDTLQSYSSSMSGTRENGHFKYLGNGEWQLKSTKGEIQTDRLSEFGVSEFLDNQHNIPEQLIKKELDILPDTKIRRIPHDSFQTSSPLSSAVEPYSLEKESNTKEKPATEPLVKNRPNPIVRQTTPIPRGFKPHESDEEIANCLRTIKQYRDYQKPSEPSWNEYVEEIFHILGFATKKIESRLMTLRFMGSDQDSVAIVGTILPGEDLEKTIHGESWIPYLFSTADHQIPWGILTDGINIKIFQMHTDEIQLATDWLNLDDIINKEWFGSFSALFRVFAFIKEGEFKETKTERPQNQPQIQTDGSALRIQFWEKMVEKGFRRGIFTSRRTPSKCNWMSIASGRAGYVYRMAILRTEADVQFYIDKADYKENKKFFDALLLQKNEIEARLNKKLEWQRLDTKRACRILYAYPNVSINDLDGWDTLQDQMLDLVVEFKKVFTPYYK